MLTPDRRAAAVAAAFFAVSAALYGLAAQRAWFAAAPDQAVVNAAMTLASAGPDADGTVRPLFFHLADTLWLQPIPVYVMALALKLLRGAYGAPALAAAAMAALDAALTYLVARRVFRQDRPAVLAAALLLLTPSHLAYGSTASAALYPIPFVLLWLLALVQGVEEPRTLPLFAATAALGAGLYTTPEAVWTMAAYALLTAVLLARDPRRLAARLLYCAAGFVVWLLPPAAWYAAHPRTYLDTMGRWAFHPAYIRSPIEGLGTFFRYDVFARHLSLYWDFFSPRHLFFDVQAPGLGWIGGVLPWPLVLLLPLGLYHLVFRDRSAEASRYAIIWGFLLAPIAAAAFDERRSVAGAMTLLPFAALLGAAGVEALLELRAARALTASEKPQTPELH